MMILPKIIYNKFYQTPKLTFFPFKIIFELPKNNLKRL